MQALVLGRESRVAKLVLAFDDRGLAEKLLEEAGFTRNDAIPNCWLGKFNWREVEVLGHKLLTYEPWHARFVNIAPLTLDAIPRDGKPAPTETAPVEPLVERSQPEATSPPQRDPYESEWLDDQF